MSQSTIVKNNLLWRLNLGTITTNADGYYVINLEGIAPWTYQPIAVWQNKGGSPHRQFIVSANHTENHPRFRVLDNDGIPLANETIDSVYVVLAKINTMPQYN